MRWSDEDPNGEYLGNREQQAERICRCVTCNCSLLNLDALAHLKLGHEVYRRGVKQALDTPEPLSARRPA